jgi:hypothetical protein
MLPYCVYNIHLLSSGRYILILRSYVLSCKKAAPVIHPYSFVVHLPLKLLSGIPM